MPTSSTRSTPRWPDRLLPGTRAGSAMPTSAAACAACASRPARPKCGCGPRFGWSTTSSTRTRCSSCASSLPPPSPRARSPPSRRRRGGRPSRSCTGGAPFSWAYRSSWRSHGWADSRRPVAPARRRAPLHDFRRGALTPHPACLSHDAPRKPRPRTARNEPDEDRQHAMKYRALVFGVDAATFEVIDPLVAAGKMPALAGLMARGVRAGLRSTWPPVSAPAWVTFLTGKQPGKHGVFNFQNFDSRHYSGFSETLVNSSYFSGRTLLDHAAGTAGVRTLSYRIPMTYPPWDVPNGVVVSGFPLPDRRRTYVRPVEAEAELGPASPLSYDQTAAAMKSLDVAALDASNRVELEGLERAVGRYVARGFELVIGFTGIPDTLHHAFWAFHDPRSPLHDPAAPPALRTIIERAYVEIDAAIGRLTSGLDDDTAVIVISDHGGGPAPFRHVNLYAFPAARGYLERAGAGRARVATTVGRVLERGRLALPGRLWLKRRMPERLGRSLRALRKATGAIAWERTRAYAIPIHYPVSGVWVNLIGRQPKGIVAPGEEYEQLRRTLVRELAELRDPDTGAPLVARVALREEVYAGAHVASAPDLIVETVAGHHGGTDLDRLVSPVSPAVLSRNNGSHTFEGILVAAGGPFRKGAVLDPPSLADVLPTALHLLGVPLPDGLDGRAVEEALEPAYVAEHPVGLTAARHREAGTTAAEDDEAEMRRFLQGLGYVE